MVHLSYEAVVSVTRSHMSSCHLGSADSAVCGSVEVPGKECNINARVSFCFPDGHLSHLQHNIQTQRSKQGLYSFPQHTGEC